MDKWRFFVWISIIKTQLLVRAAIILDTSFQAIFASVTSLNLPFLANFKRKTRQITIYPELHQDPLHGHNHMDAQTYEYTLGIRQKERT